MSASARRKIVEMNQEIERLQHNLMVTSQAKADFQALAKRRLEEIQALRKEMAQLRETYLPRMRDGT